MAEMQCSNLDQVSLTQSLENASEMDGKYLTFWTDQRLFGVSIADVVQIVGIQEITEVPEFPYYAKGIINLRGSIIPIIDVRLRIGKPEKEYDERTCIIVTSMQEKLMGFVVDAVDEVTDIEEEQVSPPPSVSGAGDSGYLTGVAVLEQGIVLLVDTKKLLGEQDLALMYASDVLSGGN